MAKVFGDYISDIGYQAFLRLVGLTRELKHQVSVKEAMEAHEKDNSFPAPNDFAFWFTQYSDAAEKAYRTYLKELPDDEEEEDEEDNKEEITEVKAEPETPIEPETVAEPESDKPEESEPEPPLEETLEQYPDTADPFDDDPPILPAISESDVVALDDEPDEKESTPPQEYEREGEDVVKLYNSEHLSSPARPPKVSLVNYLFDCRVRIIDPRYKDGRFFYAEDTGFYAAISEHEDKITEIDYLTDSLVEGIPNQFVVEQSSRSYELRLISDKYSERIDLPFPGPCHDTFYIVSKSFAEAARAIGRSTDDLIFPSDFDKANYGNYPEIIVRKFRRL